MTLVPSRSDVQALLTLPHCRTTPVSSLAFPPARNLPRRYPHSSAFYETPAVAAVMKTKGMEK